MRDTSVLVLLTALTLSTTFLTHSMATFVLPEILMPLMWLANGVALHFAIKEFLTPSSQETTQATVERKKTTTTKRTKIRTKKTRATKVKTTLDMSKGQTELQKFQFELKHKFDFVNRCVSSRLPYLAGTDLKTLKSIKSELVDEGNAKFFLRKYIFSLNDIPSVIQSALGTDVMEIEESCIVYEGKKRISRFENTSLTNLFRVVVIETYTSREDNTTVFDVRGTMHITGLVWPASSLASSFAAQNYTPKLKEKLERIQTVLSDGAVVESTRASNSSSKEDQPE